MAQSKLDSMCRKDYSIAIVGGPSLVDKTALQIVDTTTRIFLDKNKNKIDQHIFISVSSSCFLQGEEGDDILGIYFSGLRSLCVCGSYYPELSFLEKHKTEEEKYTRWKWELARTVAHELSHLLQDIQGKLDNGLGDVDDDMEIEADIEAEKIADRVINRNHNGAK